MKPHLSVLFICLVSEDERLSYRHVNVMHAPCSSRYVHKSDGFQADGWTSIVGHDGCPDDVVSLCGRMKQLAIAVIFNPSPAQVVWSPNSTTSRCGVRGAQH